MGALFKVSVSSLSKQWARCSRSAFHHSQNNGRVVQGQRFITLKTMGAVFKVSISSLSKQWARSLRPAFHHSQDSGRVVRGHRFNHHVTKQPSLLYTISMTPSCEPCKHSIRSDGMEQIYLTADNLRHNWRERPDWKIKRQRTSKQIDCWLANK